MRPKETRKARERGSEGYFNVRIIVIVLFDPDGIYRARVSPKRSEQVRERGFDLYGILPFEMI